MIIRRPGHARGRTQLGWLDSAHTFSFDRYYDPRYMGCRQLRVINEDRVQPGAGFPTHGHRDMEILTYVLEGALEHKDSLDHGSVIRPGEIQRMTAGTGIQHSEYNPSRTEPVHFLQIWIVPEQRDLEPGYEQRAFGAEVAPGQLALIAGKDGRDGAIMVHQEVAVYAARPMPGERLMHRLSPDRHAWVQIARGAVTLNGLRLQAGDGAAVSQEEALSFGATEPSELLLFDLA